MDLDFVLTAENGLAEEANFCPAGNDLRPLVANEERGGFGLNDAEYWGVDQW